jgi:hypothetical protein
MNLDDLEKKIWSAARMHRPSEAVPYAFEKGIMARIRGLSAGDPWIEWGRALWKAVTPCVVLMLLLSFWSFRQVPIQHGTESFAAEFDQSLLGPLQSMGEVW